MTPEMRRTRLGGIRIEVIVQTEMVIDGRRLSSKYDLFRLSGIERALGGAFSTSSMLMDTLLDHCTVLVQALALVVFGRNEHYPSVQIQSTLTFARQGSGWRGKHMQGHLQQAWAWAELAVVAQEKEDKDVEFTYEGVELDHPEMSPLIQDFIDHADWSLQTRVRDRELLGLMLRSTYGSRYLPKVGIYTDCVGGAYHYIGLYGDQWREHVRSIG